MKRILKIASLMLLSVMLITMVSCNKGEVVVPQDTGYETEEEPSADINIELEDLPPEHLNPLTGLEAAYGVEGSRPIAVMLNNIYQALPQVGISKADVLFECLAEGGITRLMGVFAEYKDLEVIGSVRSSRPYYLDCAQMFDAIYCHAGGSDEAYSQIASRRIDNIDGVRGDPLRVYYRDQERLKTMSLEHTMMTTGKGIVDTIEYCDFRTNLRGGFEYPFDFADMDSSAEIGTENSLHIYLPISNVQTVDYVYNADTKEYLRYQYNGDKHIDGGNGEQLSFKNIIVLFTDVSGPYDDKGHIRVGTTGTGTGYLASEGKYKAINWSRESADGNLTLTDAQTGEKLVINRGKTFINFCPNTTKDASDMNCTDRAIG